jgi:hypothetical protein
MSDIAIFKEMINSKATVPLESRHSKNIVTLKELQSADYAVTIHGMPDADQTIIIKVDVFEAPKEIFANSKHECKRADFVIVADTNRGKFIVYIEIKAGGGGSEKEIKLQLKGAHCFVAYCREIGQAFWHNPDFLKDYKYRFVSIRNVSIPKRPTHLSSGTIIHDHPDRMLKITSKTHIQFNNLIGKK